MVYHGIPIYMVTPKKKEKVNVVTFQTGLYYKYYLNLRLDYI